MEAGWPQAEVARLFRVSRATVAKWVRRFREGGPDALLDRSSRPLRNPRQTGQLQEAAIRAARRSFAWGPHRIGWRLGIARSTVYAVLRRAGLHRLAWLHRTTREIVRYEHARPGSLVHLDIKKLGRIPQGGGKRILPGFAETHSGPQRGPRLGFDFLHVAMDDHSRYAYVEALPDERGATAAAFLVRALTHFGRQGITVERILTDNGACYVSRIFTDTATARNIRLKRTRPFRPQTNGRRRRSTRSSRPSGPTYDRTTPTASGSTRCLGSLRITITGVHTAASAGLLPPPACKQRPWELQLEGEPREHRRNTCDDQPRHRYRCALKRNRPKVQERETHDCPHEYNVAQLLFRLA